MLNLEDAIKHCEEQAKELREQADWYGASKLPRIIAKTAGCLECANEHEQLAGWLKELQALRSERPQGEWIEHEDGYNVCPYCKYRTAFSYPFCPYCGADMKGGAE